ncbi:glycosyltransferase [Vibrio alginolyticus]|uniref:glycosyltransferase n=1 Tax=Vibrio alginolyticus TaxID=663 RepID=UPI001BD6C213|nr:glycosyltransferase [Vibrio alginolyticus]MBS9950500.1 glycosyltransferase [Vibrio alginolyticus]
MKALVFLNSGEAGGAEKVVSILSHSFVKDDVGIVFIKNNVFHDFNDELTYFTLDKSEKTGNESLLTLALKLKRIVKENEIKVVQSHMYRSNYINILSKILGSRHRVQIVNCDCVSTKYTCGVKSIASKILIFSLYRFADLTITKSKAMLQDLKKYTKIKNGLVIYNPIDIKKIRAMKLDDSINFNRNDFKFEKLIVSVGRFHSQKRQNDIITSLSLLDESYGLILIGDGEEIESCKNLAESLNVSERIIFTGKVTNPFSILAQCDVFVMASSCEGFPNALAEAMACGLPIISSDHLSGAKEILSERQDVLNLMKYKETFSCEEYGILYPVGNVTQLTQSIEYMFMNDLNCYYSERSLFRVNNYKSSRSIKLYCDVLLSKY